MQHPSRHEERGRHHWIASKPWRTKSERTAGGVFVDEKQFRPLISTVG